MTSVLSLTTPGYAIQASDRQLSRNGEPDDPAANKVVLTSFSDALMSFAYTGPAWTKTKPTDHWLAELLYGGELSGAMIQLGEGGGGDIGAAISRVLAGLRETGPAWHKSGPGIVACGLRWQRKRPSWVWPAIYTIRYQAADGSFTCTASLPRREASDLLALSVEGSEDIDGLDVLARVDRNRRIPEAEAVLVDEIRKLAIGNPGQVGSNLMLIRLRLAPPPVTPLVSFLPLTDADLAIYRLGRAPSTGSYTPWILSPGAATAPSIATGVRSLSVGSLDVGLIGVPAAKAEPLDDGRTVRRMGGSVQRRRGWGRNTHIPPPPDDLDG